MFIQKDMTIIEYIESEKKRLSKLDSVDLEREYINLMESIDARLERLKNDKDLVKVIYRGNEIIGVISLNNIEW